MISAITPHENHLNGMESERKQVAEKQSAAVNCNSLIPPILNEEIAAALKKNNLTEDKYLKNIQTQSDRFNGPIRPTNVLLSDRTKVSPCGNLAD